MDLTPQVINEVEFSMARKGYDPEQVDDFLEKLAVGVQAMHEQVAEMRQRVVVAERRANEAERRAAEQPERVVEAAAPAARESSTVAGVSAAAEAELETLKRTLLLAQRTADAAVREAEDEARRIVAAAEADARNAHEATRRSVLEEIASLESTRENLQTDLELLDRRADAQRVRLLQTLADLQRIVEESADVPQGPAATPSPAPVATYEPEPDALPPAAVEAPVREMPPAEPRPEQPPRAEPTSSFVLAEEEGDDDAWARFGPGDTDDVLDAGPRTEPVIRLDRVERSAGPSGDDAYLAELRKAMLDDTGAPDASELGFFDEPDAGRAARQNRFGRRR